MTTETDSLVSDRPRRKWLSFRLTTLFVVVTVVAMLAASPHVYHRVQMARFQWYVGRDFRTLSEWNRTKFGKIAKDLQRPFEAIFWEKTFRPNERGYLWRLSSSEQDRFVLFRPFTDPVLVLPLSKKTPTNSRAQVLLFNQRGEIIESWWFTTGRNMDLADAAIISHPNLDEPIIQLDTDAVVPNEIKKEYYALIDDNLLLLRLEDSDGNLVRNNYIHARHQIGPELPERTEAEWIQALSDPSPAEILRTLTWLGGEHGVDAANEKSAELAVVLQIRQNPEAKAAVAALVDSENPWISQAAQLALETMVDQPDNQFNAEQE